MEKADKLDRDLKSLWTGAQPYADMPVIGITGNWRDSMCTLADPYYLSVAESGGIPVIIPPLQDTHSLASLLDNLDGIIFSGGADIDPDYLNEPPHPSISVNPLRDYPEIALVRMAVARHIPVLGICRGIQIIASALGGTMYQDLATQHEGNSVNHDQSEPRGIATHNVTIESDSELSSIMGTCRLMVNSFHHQAVRSVPEGFRVTALSDDNVIEAMEMTGSCEVLAMQWHPECMILENDRSMLPIFRWLSAKASCYRKAKAIHAGSIVLDSHCDSPMFFELGAHFNVKDPAIPVEYAYVHEPSPDGSPTFAYNPLVDIHKMREGGLDATFMVAYIRQEERNPESLKAAVSKTDRILDLIEERIGECAGYASIARTPEDILSNKLSGIRSVVLGIENGYGIGTDISNVARYASRGVAYMTLCHNGDNDICDSAKGNSEHQGISAFGRDVLAEMNRTGMMVDLSHASEKSFYDAIEYSSKPIICSHSSCRKLADHPRNLTDDQMRALAASHGVMQICGYTYFLKKGGDATVRDMVSHIMHAISVMGIDHVGIGSDFDGGGGVPGFADASWFLPLTARLISEGLAPDELRKVLGGNFLNVWKNIRSI